MNTKEIQIYYEKIGDSYRDGTHPSGKNYNKALENYFISKSSKSYYNIGIIYLERFLEYEKNPIEEGNGKRSRKRKREVEDDNSPKNFIIKALENLEKSTEKN